MATLTYTDDELATLTEGEREDLEKMLAEGPDEEDGDAAEAEAEAVGDGAADKGLASDATDAESKTSATATTAVNAKTEDAPTGGSAADRAPVPAFAAPADADAQLAEIAEQRRKLITQMDEGEISAAEYAAKLDDLTTKATDLRDAKAKEAWSFEFGKGWWFQRTVPQFLDQHPEYTNPHLQQVLDQYVREEQTKSSGADVFDPALLDRAHTRVQDFVRSIAPGADAQRIAPPKPATQQPQVPSRPAPPPTLARLPAASAAGDDEFAHMSALLEKDPLAYEQAMAKMTPVQLDRYLASV